MPLRCLQSRASPTGVGGPHGQCGQETNGDKDSLYIAPGMLNTAKICGLGNLTYIVEKGRITAFEITEIRNIEVDLRDASMLFPIFHTESKERFGSLLKQDERKNYIIEFLAKGLESIDADL